MRYLLVYTFLICSFSQGLHAQKKTAKLIDWKFLSHVDYEDKYYEEYEAWYLYPKFDEKIKALDNRQVIIKGYIIPLDVEGGVYALSAYPFSACFFCGGAGPESVMSLKFKGKPKKYKTDDVITFTGLLGLNSSNVDDFNYILYQTEEIE
jgi:hypothetical protein